MREGFPGFRKGCKCLPESPGIVMGHTAADELSGPVTSPKCDPDPRRFSEWTDITPSLKFPFSQTKGNKFHAIRPEVDHDNEVISRDMLWECVLSALQPGQGCGNRSPYQSNILKALSFKILYEPILPKLIKFVWYGDYYCVLAITNSLQTSRYMGGQNPGQ
jgi:hypothetical protein